MQAKGFLITVVDGVRNITYDFVKQPKFKTHK